MLQSFLDPEIVNRQVFSSLVNPPEILKFCHPSQLEERYGGTAPNVT